MGNEALPWNREIITCQKTFKDHLYYIALSKKLCEKFEVLSKLRVMFDFCENYNLLTA